jgi:Cu/Ag efflux protein CusF
LLVMGLDGPGASALPLGDQSTSADGTALAIEAQATSQNGVFRGIGVVTDIHPATGSLTINHEEIPGFMAAMEMLFRVSPRTLSDGVRPGDKVEFWVEGKTYTIRDLRVIEGGK